MILGVGIDFVEVERLASGLRKEKGLKERLFTPEEVRYCEARKNAAQHLAARFAAKEAFAKAVGTGIAGGLAFRDIEVGSDGEGKPILRLHGRAEEWAQAHQLGAIHVSLTHTSERAAAIVVLESRVNSAGTQS